MRKTLTLIALGLVGWTLAGCEQEETLPEPAEGIQDEEPFTEPEVQIGQGDPIGIEDETDLGVEDETDFGLEDEEPGAEIDTGADIGGETEVGLDEDAGADLGAGEGADIGEDAGAEEDAGIDLETQ